LARGSAAILYSIGLMTYPMYLLHTVFGAAILRLLIDVGTWRYAARPITLSANIVVAWICPRRRDRNGTCRGTGFGA
jgi:hypothetical protein